MLHNLMSRLANAARYVMHGGAMPTAQTTATRVGLMNTGELIVLFHRGGFMLLTAETTDLVRDLLDSDARAFDNLPLPGTRRGPHLYDLARGFVYDKDDADPAASGTPNAAQGGA